MKIGIIGTGSIGSVLTEAFISSGTLLPENIYIYNRSPDKALHLQKSFPGIQVVQTTDQIAQKAKLLFVCVRQPDLKPLLETLSPSLTSDHCVMSTASAVSTEQLETILSCSCGRVIPSVTNAVASGGILYSFGCSCRLDWQTKLIGLLDQISGVAFKADDANVRAASDLTGCGPAFFSKMACMYAEQAAQHGLTKEQGEELAVHMMIGLGEMLKKKEWTLEMLIKRTAAKGGVTGRGLAVIDSYAGELFSSLCRMTQQKAAEDRKEASAEFGITK